ncbi:MAG TPA: T9SS type A sorting domain-containing protein [Bacteroidia bacterium]|nr:T9SS type A sorting domain-containing protein [Bacteroidia bacterium]
MKNFTKILFAIVGMLLFQQNLVTASSSSCSDAGIAAASEDSLCTGGSSVLSLTGYIGTIFQWQRFDGTNWIDETGTGSTTDTYSVTPGTTTDYRAIVTAVSCPSDTSNTITITVGVSAPTTTGDTRCGYGTVNLNAVGAGVIKWYDVPTGGTALATGPTYTTNVATTTTFYAASSSNGGGSGVAPLPAEVTTFSSNARGFWFLAPSAFTLTGLRVPDAISSQNIAVVRFNTPAPPPIYPTVTNDFTVLFLTQGNTNTGVIPVNLPILAGDYIGILGTREASDENSYATGPYVTTIDGQSVTLSRMGMQFPLATVAPQDLWEEVGANFSRVEITYEVGCESSRTPAIATVNTSDAITIAANPPALCEGQSSVISVSSANANYNYTWSPATGLSSTTGASVTATPLLPITYTVIADDGVCGAIDSVFVSVGPASVAGTATISTDTICLGSNATLFLAGSVGNIQWQSYNGTTWVNETGPGATTNQYQVSPASSTQYQAVVTSGGCAPETTVTLNLDVLSIVDPITVNDTICGPGVVNLSASGAGLLNWYTTPTGGTSINTTGNYSPNLTATTTYYVQASAGGNYNVGAPNAGISPIPLAGSDWGLQFDVLTQCTLDRVYMTIGSISGSITINLRDAQGGPVLNTVTVPVNANSILIPINLGFTLNPGTNYRLELASGSVPCIYSSFGAVYPYTSPGSPVTITGYVNPTFGTTLYYFYFYNWEVTSGCSSNRVPVTGVVLNAPSVPVITPFGNQLSSSATSGNQWNFNGTPIPGATSQVYAAFQSGTYTVTVTDPSGCTAESLPFVYTGLNEAGMAEAGISVYPNPVKDVLNIEFTKAIAGTKAVKVMNALGEVVKNVEVEGSKNSIDLNLPAGIYSIEIRTRNNVYTTNVVKM